MSLVREERGKLWKKGGGFWFGSDEFRAIEMPQCDVLLDESDTCLDIWVWSQEEGL